MRIHVVENGQFVEYERTGECNKCGDCCRGEIVFSCNAHTEKKEQTKDGKNGLVSWEGWACFRDAGLLWWYHTRNNFEEYPGQCCKLRGDECTVWEIGAWQKTICRHWPVHPMDLREFPRCGFSFERVMP